MAEIADGACISRNVTPRIRGQFIAGKKGAKITTWREILVARHDFPQSFTHFQPPRDKVCGLGDYQGIFGRIPAPLPYISARLGLHPLTVSREGVKVLVRRSKTDQESAGVELGVASGRAVAAVQEWIAAAGLTTGPLFRHIRRGGHLTDERLTGRSIADIVKRLAGAAGLDPARYSGHSLRAGLATSAAIAGAGLTSIMKQTRHKSVDVAKTYIRDTDLWRDNVSGLVM